MEDCPVMRWVAWGGIVAFVGAWAMVGGVRRYALARSILDRPNERSSHSEPTPRGGGVGIVVPFAAVVGVVVWPSLPLLLLLAGVGLVAGVGWMDDRGDVPVRVRLVAHLLGAASLVPLALVLPPVEGWVVAGVVAWWVFFGVSAINVVNFMDGIDGLVASQLLILGVHLALWGWGDPQALVWGVVLAGACGGFLVWNRPPARIFMGDVGSGALGLMAAGGGLLLMRGSGVPLVPAFLPLYPLFLDATLTLLRRLRAGERVWEAHRSHLYQRLANGGWGHGRVTLLYGVAAALALPVAWLPPGWMRIGGIALYGAVVLGIGLRLGSKVDDAGSVGRGGLDGGSPGIPEG